MKYPPVVIYWNDAWSGRQSFGIEDAQNYTPARMQEIGFLISDTPEGITTAGSVHPEDDSLRYPNFIPRNMIERVEYLMPILDHSSIIK